MEENIKEVVYSSAFYNDLQSIYLYGYEIFGVTIADFLQDKILNLTSRLSDHSYIYPECRHLATKKQIYRNIILGNYLIIYRIRNSKVEVLRALHGSKKNKTIKATRKIKTK